MFAAAIFLGAFLLFLVQPMMGRFILPSFGGSTGVWTTCMLFFQLLLVGGYAYAHISHRWLRPRFQWIVHLLVLATAVVIYLPVDPRPHLASVTAGSPSLQILLLLGISIGVPYLVLASTGPLMQAWFRRRYPQSPPWRLYALSNLGSLLALVAYPFAVEFLFSRQGQARLWSWGFAAFVVASTGVLALTFRHQHQSLTPAASTARSPAPNIKTVLLWLALPATASAMLLATTNRICLDIAVVPFLWVLPLGIYLVTFIVSFDRPRLYNRVVFAAALLATFIALWLLPAYAGSSIKLQIAVMGGVLAVVGMICHGELYRLRPSPDRLTEYYLLISAGGALGGVFVALAAPMMFDTFMEFPLAMAACAALLLVRFYDDEASMFFDGQHRFAWLSLGVLFLLGFTQILPVRDDPGERTIARVRNFYGILQVSEAVDPKTGQRSRELVHGRITHGTQDFAAPARPTTYYTSSSGVGLMLDHVLTTRNRRVGLVGLGAGTLATYAHPGDVFRYYEINPAVEALATEYFTFLADSPAGRPEVIPGDARLSLEAESGPTYDALVLDAFSSDSIPVHLLTREAFEAYRSRLSPGGVIAVHISNAYLDLEPVLSRVAESFRMAGVIVTDTNPTAPLATSSIWVLLSEDPSILSNSRLMSRGRPLRRPIESVALWTDDFSSLYSILRPGPGRSVGP